MLIVTLTFSPLTPPPVGWGGGGEGLTKISIFSSSWNVWHLKCLPFKTPNPWWGGVRLLFFITFLGSSWHFPDFWFFDPLKFPLRPWVGRSIFLGRNHPQICRYVCILNPFSDLFVCIQRHNIPSFPSCLPSFFTHPSLLPPSTFLLSSFLTPTFLLPPPPRIP